VQIKKRTRFFFVLTEKLRQHLYEIKYWKMLPIDISNLNINEPIIKKHRLNLITFLYAKLCNEVRGIKKHLQLL
jgi:hypothetical protein